MRILEGKEFSRSLKLAQVKWILRKDAGGSQETQGQKEVWLDLL